MPASERGRTGPVTGAFNLRFARLSTDGLDALASGGTRLRAVQGTPALAVMAAARQPQVTRPAVERELG
jgi:hypothetical protein